MSYIFGKPWHLAINWAVRKAFQCILQGVIFLLAKQTRLSGTSDNESYIVKSPMRRMKVWNMWHYDQASLSSGDNMCAVSEKENLAIWWPSLLAGGSHLAAALSSPTIMSPTNHHIVLNQTKLQYLLQHHYIQRNTITWNTLNLIIPIPYRFFSV